MKNNIIHKEKEVWDRGLHNERRRIVYECNQACGTTKEKMSDNWLEVTCKNCLQRLTGKKVFKFKKGQETEDFGDTELYELLCEMLNYNTGWLPQFTADYEVEVKIKIKKAKHI